MNKNILLLIFTIACFIRGFESQCSYITNYDFFGNDLYYNAYYTNTIEDCCRLCYSNALCQAWTYVSVSQACWLKSSVGSQGRSSLSRYSGVKQIQPQPSTTTTTPFAVTTTTTTTLAVPTTTVIVPTTTIATTTTTTTTLATRASICLVETNVNYPGYDLGGTIANFNVASVADCCNLCGANPLCFGYAYDVPSKYCFFKSNGFNTVPGQPYSGITSGQVTLRG